MKSTCSVYRSFVQNPFGRIVWRMSLVCSVLAFFCCGEVQAGTVKWKAANVEAYIGLPNATHQVQVNDMGASPPTSANDDLAVLGASALGPRPKWSQPPVLFEPTNLFYGWNEFSVYGERVAADDWINVTNVNVAIGAIRWWGSFLGWSAAERPPQMPDRFHIGVWTDTPAFVDGYSHPGMMRGAVIVSNYTHQFVGWDFDPRTGTFEACFQFDVVVPAGQWVFAPGQVSWISIAAIYAQELPPYPWGWKTRPRDPSSQAPDDAVRIFDPKRPTLGESYRAGEPIWWPTPTNSWDLAFQLFSGATPGSGLTWSQRPVPYQVPNGFIGWNEPSIAGSQQIVADDWICFEDKPVTDLHWWGSFLGWSDPANPPAVSPYGFLVTIWNDVPVGTNNPFSHPGVARWHTVCTNFTREFAGWDFDPRSFNAPPEACFKFEQDLSRGEWFQQDPGTNIYWISIAALYRTNQFPQYPWGWKTRPRDRDSLAPDDAVRIYNPTSPLFGDLFRAGEPIEYPPGVSWDTAFVLTTSPCQPPVIERQPQDVTVECRGTASFTVVASGTPTLTYQWHMNGVAIAGATSTTLTIPDVDLKYNGNVFTVVVANDCGSVTSRGALLTVVDTIPPVIVCPGDRVVSAPTWTGTVVTFDVSASDTCDPNPQVVCAPPSGSMFPIGDTTVSCTASDRSGNVARCSFDVTVLYTDGGTNLAKWVQEPNLSATNSSISFVANQPRILADDFLCTYTGPITDIHIWGVWDQDLLDTNAVFCLGLWSDRPPTNNLPSNPTNLLWSQCFSSGQYAVQLVTNLPPVIPPDPCSPPWFWILDLESMSYLTPCSRRAWRYDFSIPPAEALTQTNGQIYWLSVSVRSPNPFGWTMTKEPWTNYWHDPATFGHVNAVGQPLMDWSTNAALRVWDQAFAITTTPTETNVFKWNQVPDLGTNGLDVWATLPTILADDFRCTQTGPITDVHLWGSWLNDVPDANATFFLSLWSDVPANPPQFSRPGVLLWSEVFTPGQYNGIPYASAREGFYDPNLTGTAGLIGQDTAVWQYDFSIPAGRAYTQTNGNVYWLAVSLQPSLTNVVFGWKTCPTNWNDDAVFGHMGGPGQPLQDWRELRHPWTGRSLDLAFAITTPPLVVEPTSDLGDAPDSSNNEGAPMTAYPPGGVVGVAARYPTVYQTGSPPYGPIHRAPWALAWLGTNVSLEVEADIGPDQDGPNNIVPQLNAPDLDRADDGVLFPLTLPSCTLTTFRYLVSSLAGATGVVYVNVWFDWNRDGDWNDAPRCADNSFAPEWAVQNQRVAIGGGSQVVTTPAFRPWHTNEVVTPLWMRITVSERERSPNEPGAAGGSGPMSGYEFGETEDYYVTNYLALDFGDAPDPPFPTRLVNNGARHVIVAGVQLGNTIDGEPDGQVNDGADEDGVAFSTPVMPGQVASVNVAPSVQGFLWAWIDFSNDGDWDDPGEQIASGQPVGPIPHNLAFAVPWSAIPGSSVAARFRFTTVTNTLTYTGLAPNGEVEDYTVRIDLPTEPTVDLGDAPDSSNSYGLPMTAYAGVPANFPTVHWAGSPPYGPMHRDPRLAYLGTNWSEEVEADIGPDWDGVNNLDPPNNVADRDEHDNGVFFPLTLPHCAETTFRYLVMMYPGQTLYVNVWFDWTRDGDWNDTPLCSDGINAPEWAVRDQVVTFSPTDYTRLTPPFRAWHPDNTIRPLWMRISLTERPWLASGQPDGAAGAGPLGGFDLGETEDYYVTNYQTLDFGDAPDPPYPTFLRNNGARHVIVPGLRLGRLIDAEADGQIDDGADEDGVVFTTGLVPGQVATVSVAPSANGFLNAWIDFSGDGDWDDAGDQIFSGQLVSPPAQNLSFPVPWTAVTGTNVAARFRFGTVTNLTYTGLAPDGEVEDYPVPIPPQEPTSDLGDAPDSSNHRATNMTAYPAGGPLGVLARFPTVFEGSPAVGTGPIHWHPRRVALLGTNASLEVEADVGPDEDGINNILPGLNRPDQDGLDDGVLFPLLLPHCRPTTFDFLVTVMPSPIEPPPLYVNVWFDWNRDGDWNDTLDCAAASPAQEWAVQNQRLLLVTSGLHKVTTLPFVAWHRGASNEPVWMRITLSEQTWPALDVGGNGGAGPPWGYDYGETEDYYVTNYVTEVLDFGDAPDPPYPTFLRNNGARHVIVPGMRLGGLIDAEPDGQVDDGADEDGVAFTTPLVPGQMATVNVIPSANGFLNAWIDFGGDGDWDDAGDQIFSGQLVSPPAQNISFPVPWTAVTGTNVAARFRFSMVTNLTYTGQAPNGEVEDYLVPIEPQVIKFLQLPDLTTNGLDVLATVTNMLADDFRCLETGPITDIHVWGSWLNDRVDTNAVFWIGLWTDVPAGEVSPYSQPRELYWGRWFKPGEYTVRLLADAQERFYDPNTRTYLGSDRRVWQYDFFPETAFLEQGTSDIPKIYWLSVAALTSTNTTFGWKTALEHFNDDGVYGHVTNGIPLRDWRELRDPAQRSLDLAFAISTIRTNWPPCPDQTKFYAQNPDLFEGNDILASYNLILADDFVCTSTGLITNIVVWGSWLDDQANPNVSFLLGLWTDVPASAGRPSHPGSLLVQHWYHPGDYVVHEPEAALEGFLDPRQNLFLGTDSAAWKYEFVPKSNRWRQDGTVGRPRTYWLSVIAATTNELFGWKTSTDHLQDSAVFGSVDMNWVFREAWRPIPNGAGPVDLAFSIGTDISPPFITSIVYSYWNRNVVITWNACPGKIYRLQYKHDLDDHLWKDIPGDVVALGWTASKAVLRTTDHRFYRVVQDPPMGPPVLSIFHTPGGGVEVDWGAAGFTLQSAASITGPWMVVPPGLDSGPYAIPAPTGQAFYRLSNGSIYSANAVGRVTLDLVVGLNLIANPFTYGDNHLNTILPLPPSAAGTTVFRWNRTLGALAPPIVFNGTAWTSTSPDPSWPVLRPGESFFIQVTAPRSVTLIGDVLQGAPSLPIPAGYSLLASQFPETDSLGTGPGVGLEFPAVDGDAVFLWNAGAQVYDPPWIYVLGEGWVDGFGNLVPNGPVIPVGRGFALQTMMARNWKVIF